jgi:hypothetical protein
MIAATGDDLIQGLIVRVIDGRSFDTDTLGEHAKQTKIMLDAYCRSTFRTKNRRQMEIKRHALHRKCYDSKTPPPA